MAFFLTNKCQYRGCGQIFPDLDTLILHVESVHINFNPEFTAKLEEQHPAALPLSYVLKYTKGSRQNPVTNSTPEDAAANAPSQNTDYEKLKSSETETKKESEAETKTVNEAFGFDNTDFEKPKRPKTETKEETNAESEAFSSLSNYYFPPPPISTRLRSKDKTDDIDEDKPNIKSHCCSLPGCKKRYTTLNGLKYHWRFGHKSMFAGKTGNKEEDQVNKENKELVHVANPISQYTNSPNESLDGFASSKLNTGSDEEEINVVDCTESEED